MKHLLSLFLTTVVVSVSAEPTYQEDYSTPVQIGNHRFNTEMADTPEKMQRGMMFRPTMATNQAMLFTYRQPQSAQFWMKNTLIPLDMLFFDAQGVLMEIKHNVPPCQTGPCDIYRSKASNIQYIIEIKGGTSQLLGIQVGDALRQ